MFLRRLLLLSGLALIAGSMLTLQLTRLTLWRGSELREEAQSKLLRKQWTPTVRGAILDRKGRVLAQDRPSYNVQVPYNVITAEWAREAALSTARRTIGYAGWLELSPSTRDDVISQLEDMYKAHLDQGWTALAATLGITRAELDLRRDEVVTQISRQQEAISARRLAKETQEATEKGEELTPARLAVMQRRASAPIAELKAAHAIANRVTDDLAFRAGNLGSEDVTPQLDTFLVDGSVVVPNVRPIPRLPGLTINDSGDRDYPYEATEISVSRRTLPSPLRSEDDIAVTIEGVACHIIGRLRDRVFGDARTAEGNIILGDAAQRKAFLAANPAAASGALTAEGTDRGAYFENDHVGDTSVEASFEHSLRGLRGLATTHLDTGRKEYIPAVRGEDVTLTLDVMLQSRVQAAMSPEVGLAVVQPWHMQESTTQPTGTPLHGAAVVLDIDTAEILAAVSTPTFTRRQLREAPQTVFEDTLTFPGVNRCWQRPYPPGSIVKGMILAGAVTFGNYNPIDTIPCAGHLIPDRTDIYRCLIFKRYHTTHSIVLGHDLTGIDAVMVSCNIFFYTMGRRMGPEAIVRLYREFGVAEPFDLGVGTEFIGQLGKHNDGSDLRTPDAILMGIGQGPVAWTPLHAADSMATLARSGVRVSPHIIKGSARESRELGLDPRGVAMAMEGLHLAVNGKNGTGRQLTFDGVEEPIFNAPGVKVWGKTGTATAPELRTKDPDGSGPEVGEVVERGDHSWFVVMVGRDRPRYAIAVVIDYGGSGGRVSGPITNQIIHALIAEGYL
jgi:penicillin-binding protein 2